MDESERPVMFTARFPEVRLEVISALRSLADPGYQSRQWGKYEEGVAFYDDFSLNVHILYDDSAVLPDPSDSAPEIIAPSEVDALRELELALGPLLDRLGDAADELYMTSPEWTDVVEAARRALSQMRRTDGADCDPP